MSKKDIIKNIKTAFDYQDVDNWKQDCKRTLEFFKGNYYKLDKSSKYRIFTHYNLVNLIVPNLYYQDPYINVKPKRRQAIQEGVVVDNVRSAILMENVINKTIVEIKFKNEIRKVIQDALTHGFGVLKVGYSLDTVSEENIEYIKNENIFCMRINPFDFGFDPMATGVEDARYLIHRIVRPLESVKKQYKKADELVGEILDETKKKKKDDSKEGGEFCTLYEYHDQENGKIHLVTKEKDKELEKKDNPYEFTGSHFIILKFAGENDSFRGIPMLSTIEDESIAINETVSMMVNHLQMFPGQVMYEEGAVDEDELDAIENGEQGSMLKVQNGALREGRVKKENPLQMGAEYFSVQNQLQSWIDRVLGIPDFQRSVSTKRKTATEVTYEQSDSTIRREYFLDFVKDAVLNATEKIAALIQQFYDKKRMIRIEGEYVDFVEYSKDDIQGEYDFDFDVQSLRFNQASKFQQIVNGLNILATHSQAVPAFAEMLQNLDGKKLGKEMWKQLGLNYDSFAKNIGTHKEHDPYQENQWLEEGRRLEDPFPNEPHDEHILIHEPVIRELLASQDPKRRGGEEGMRHLQMHEYIKQTKSLGGAKATAETAQPAPTEPEVVNNFTSNTPLNVQ